MLQKVGHFGLIICLLFLVSACDESKDESSSANPLINVAPTADTIFPEDEVLTAEPDLIVEISFTELMDVDSLIAGTTLTVKDTPRDASVTTEDELFAALDPNDDAIFNEVPVVQFRTFLNLQVPDSRFALSTEYEVTVDARVKEREQSNFEEQLSLQGEEGVQFRIRDGIWNDPSRFSEPVAADILSPNAHSSYNGSVFVVWHQVSSQTSSNTNVWVSRFDLDPRTTSFVWRAPSDENETAEIVETGQTGNAFDPSVASHESGTALIAWAQSDGATSQIRTRYFDGTQWLSVLALDSSSVLAELQEIEMIDEGRAIIVWRERGLDSDEIKSALFNVDALGIQSWSNLSAVDTSSITGTLGRAESLKLERGRDDELYLIWAHEIDGRQGILFSEYNKETAVWTPSRLMDHTNIFDSSSPDVAVDTNGAVYAVWQAFDGTRFNIESDRRVLEDWDGPMLLEMNNSGDAFSPQIDTDLFGNAAAVWRSFSGVNPIVYSARFEPALGWGPPESISDSGINAGNLLFNFDFEGNGSAFWLNQAVSLSNVSVARFSQFDLWANETFDFESGGLGRSLVAVQPFRDGRFLLLWNPLTTDGIKLNFSLFN